MGSYVYCAGNPVKLVDPDGRGFNGGFAVCNNSNYDISIIGDGKVGEKESGGAYTLKPHHQDTGNQNNIRFIKGRKGYIREHNGYFRNPTDGDFINRKTE